LAPLLRAIVPLALVGVGLAVRGTRYEGARPPPVTRGAPVDASGADFDDHEPAGELVLGARVVRGCTPIRAQDAGNVEVEAGDVLRALGDCLTRGALRDAPVYVSGGARARDLLTRALHRVGVLRSRIRPVVDGVAEDEARVELRLGPGRRADGGSDVVVAVRRSELIAFLMSDPLDD